ncbi:MAG: nitrogen regulation protein NR(I), partial [Rhodospirillaceae bacterium]|nr:nitrogen regulation protein NR(I) [Rhodospirillaceae bacterium]
RLNVAPLRLPPLRERTEDVPELVQHFLSEAAEEGLPWKTISNAAMDRLKQHSWPGNVRELENMVKRMAALVAEDEISSKVVEIEFAESPTAKEDSTSGGLSHSVEMHLKSYFDAHSASLPAAGLYDRVLREVERPLIALTLEATNGNQIKAADVLGVNRNTLRKKIRDLDIPIIKNGGKQ